MVIGLQIGKLQEGGGGGGEQNQCLPDSENPGLFGVKLHLLVSFMLFRFD